MSSLVLGIFFMTGGSNASESQTIPSYYNVQGYKGNNTFYLFATNSSTPRYMNVNKTPYAGSNASTPDGVLNNTLSLAVGYNSTSVGDVNQQFRESYESGNTNQMYIYIPISCVGSTMTTGKASTAGTYQPQYEVGEIKLSLNYSGLPGAYHTELEGYATGFNVTDVNLSAQLENNELNTYLFIGSFLKEAGIAFSTASYLSSISGNMTPGYATSNINSGNGNRSIPYWISNFLGGQTVAPVEDVYGASVVMMIAINESDFSNLGYVNVSALNIIDGLGPAGYDVIANGAYSQISISTAPAYRITGTVKMDNSPAVNQTILLTQRTEPNSTNPTGNETVAQFYETTNSEGQYQFFGEPGYAYSIQAITPIGPIGYASTRDNIGPKDYNDSSLDLNVSSGYVAFKESGLPSETSWSVTVDGHLTNSSTSNSIGFILGSGSHNFTIGSVSGYYGLPNSGTFNVDSINQTETVSFIDHGNITFTESGLSSGDSWTVTLYGTTTTTKTSQGPSMEFADQSFGSYNFIVGGPSGYTVSPSNSYVSLNSPSATQNIQFSVPPPSSYAVTFTESGVPSGVTWGVTLAGSSKSSTSSSITFSKTDGSYSFTAQDAYSSSYLYAPAPSSGTVTVNGGGVTVHISYSITSCIYALTPILMANGTYMFAENIHSGDRIMTYNLTTGMLQPETVQLAYISNQSEMYTINGLLKMAPDQKVLTSNGYQEAQNLTTNDTIFNVYTHSWQKVNSITVKTGFFEMYDFYIGVNRDYIAWSYVLADKLP